MQWAHTWTSSGLWDSKYQVALLLRLTCCYAVSTAINSTASQKIWIFIFQPIPTRQHMFAICMHDAPKHKHTLNITCDKTWIWMNTNCSKYKKKVCFNYASTTKDIKTVTIKSRHIVRKSRLSQWSPHFTHT
jgi:hypothetical protein